jgi:hypothetical protein
MIIVHDDSPFPAPGADDLERAMLELLDAVMKHQKERRKHFGGKPQS